MDVLAATVPLLYRKRVVKINSVRAAGFCRRLEVSMHFLPPWTLLSLSSLTLAHSSILLPASRCHISFTALTSIVRGGPGPSPCFASFFDASDVEIKFLRFNLRPLRLPQTGMLYERLKPLQISTLRASVHLQLNRPSRSSPSLELLDDDGSALPFALNGH